MLKNAMTVWQLEDAGMIKSLFRLTEAGGQAANMHRNRQGNVQYKTMQKSRYVKIELRKLRKYQPYPTVSQENAQTPSCMGHATSYG